MHNGYPQPLLEPVRTTRVTGQNPPPPPRHLPLETYPKDIYPPGTYPLDNYPLDTYPLGHIPLRTHPPDFKMPYLVHASCVDYILHFKNIDVAEIAFICDYCRCNKADRYFLCQEGLNPHNY